MTNDQIPRIGADHRQPHSAVQYGVRLRSGTVVGCLDCAAADEFLAAYPMGVLVQRSDWTDVEDVAAQQREERAEAEARPHDGEQRDGVVYVVEGEEHGALYAAANAALARDWIATYGPGSYPGVNLSVTALAVER